MLRCTFTDERRCSGERVEAMAQASTRARVDTDDARAHPRSKRAGHSRDWRAVTCKCLDQRQLETPRDEEYVSEVSKEPKQLGGITAQLGLVSNLDGK